jgi:hypothetical protein
MRFEVLRRDDHTCRYCGASAPDVQLTVDHVVPVALGGASEPANLVTACRDCNAGKSSTGPDEKIVAQVSADAMRWSKAMQQAAEQMANQFDRAKDYIADATDAWESYRVGVNDDGSPIPVPRPGDWKETVARWHDAGVPIEVLQSAVASAMGRKNVPNHQVWRYFCGIMWRKLSEMQELAAEIASGNR